MNDYASWYTEIHPYRVGLEVTRMVAAHLGMRLSFGSAVIVCDRPRSMLATIKRRWGHVLQRLEDESAAVSSTLTKTELKQYHALLTAAQFLVEQPDERITSAVWFIDPDDFNQVPKGIMTIYVLSELTMQQLLFWARQMDDDSAVVIFRKEPLTSALGRSQTPQRGRA